MEKNKKLQKKKKKKNRKFFKKVKMSKDPTGIKLVVVGG